MSNPAGRPPEHFIVFVPGYMGSKLRDRTTGEILWVDLPGMLLRDPLHLGSILDQWFEKMTYPNDNLEPAGILDQVVFAPPLFKQEQYGRMLVALEKMGYQIDPEMPSPDKPAAYSFAYDWRQDNRISARELGQAIDRWGQNHPGANAWLIGHSNGGIVSRWYIEKEGGKEKVDRLFLMGSPWNGAPKSIQVMLAGLDMLFLRFFNRFNFQQRTRDLIRSFPSFYQLIPSHKPFLRNLGTDSIDLFSDLSWLEKDGDRQMLADAKRFNDDLGTTLSVETLCFFGVKKPTTTSGLLRTEAGGQWIGIEWDRTEAGDGTVPEQSAVHPEAREKLPFSVGHGDIYVNPAVLEKLEWELIRKYSVEVLAEARTENLQVQFETDADVYAPSQSIWLWALVHRIENEEPVFDAQVDVRLIWREAIPGGPQDEPQGLPSIQLPLSDIVPGRYEGYLEAPYQPGYYAVEATVQVPGEPDLVLEELILVERDDEAESAGAEPEAVPQMSERPMEVGGEFESPAPQAGSEDELDTVLRGGTLSDSLMGEEEGEFEPLDEQPETAPTRYINAEIEDYPESEPLTVGEAYTLAFSVALEAAHASITADEGRMFQPGEQLVELKVFLTSEDFTIHTHEPQTLRVPRQGRSKNKARFDIEPRRAGTGTVTAAFFKNNNYIQGMTLAIHVDEPGDHVIEQVEVFGRPPDSAFAVKPRDLSVFIKKVTDGFSMTLVGPVQGEATLKITPQQLNRMVADLRTELLDIVYLYPSGSSFHVFPRGQKIPNSVDLVFQSRIKISEEANQEALRRLAKAGWLLYNDLFYSTNDPDTVHLGDTLRKLSKEAKLKIQIVSQEFMLPWGALYMAEEYDPENIDWEMFLGFKHIIEHIPLQSKMTTLNNEIMSQPNLYVSLNLNTDIDREMGGNLIGEQRKFWEEVSAAASPLHVDVHTSDEEFYKALNNPESPDQIIYFYGHAKSYNLDDEAGPNATGLTLTGRKKVTLKELKWRAPVTKGLPGSPLVFINACESAELSPLFYDGLMPYFTAKGARGMIGTECEVPALFAAEWARRFFRKFLAGNANLGDVFLALRRSFFINERNLLGLLYAVYCDGDTVVSPGVPLP